MLPRVSRRQLFSDAPHLLENDCHFEQCVTCDWFVCRYGAPMSAWGGTPVVPADHTTASPPGFISTVPRMPPLLSLHTQPHPVFFSEFKISQQFFRNLFLEERPHSLHARKTKWFAKIVNSCLAERCVSLLGCTPLGRLPVTIAVCWIVEIVSMQVDKNSCFLRQVRRLRLRVLYPT